MRPFYRRFAPTPRNRKRTSLEATSPDLTTVSEEGKPCFWNCGFRTNTVTTLVFMEEPGGERESLTPKSIASRQLFGLGRIRYPGRTMLLRPSRGGTTPRPTMRGQRTNIGVTTSIIKLDFLKVLDAVSQNIYYVHVFISIWLSLSISVYLLIYIDICVHSGRPIDI